MRKPFIAGNWKMHTNHREAAILAAEIVDRTGSISDVDISVCPPHTSLMAVGGVLCGSVIRLGAQNMHWEEKGAYTGEISSNMLLTLNCRYVILGHSERRAYFHESDDTVNRKVKAALSTGLSPIVCVGETRDERENGITEQVVETQVRGAFEGLTPEMFDGTVIAYEPVWAIGTGLTATTDQAQGVHRFIRDLLAELLGDDTAASTRIQYGGSMKPGNAGELLAQPDIDGGLIGGAALDAESFEAIVRAAC